MRGCRSRTEPWDRDQLWKDSENQLVGTWPLPPRLTFRVFYPAMILPEEQTLE